MGLRAALSAGPLEMMAWMRQPFRLDVLYRWCREVRPDLLGEVKELVGRLVQDGWLYPEREAAAGNHGFRRILWRAAPWCPGEGALERVRLRLDPQYREEVARRELERAERMAKGAVVPVDRRRQSGQRAARGRHGRLEPVLQPW